MSERCLNAKAGSVVMLAGLVLAGCAQTPFGPSVQVMPGPGKTFEAFQSDQAGCKSYAADQVRGQAEASNQRAVGTAVLTTVLSAGIGAAAGSFGGVAGPGAAIGAASGSAIGAGIGAQNSSIDQMNIQQQYDNAFAQCMYAKGEQVPGFAPLVSMAPPVAAHAVTGPDPALVRATQAELNRLHYLDETPDGAMGPKTAGAIRTYQQASGAPVTGSVSQALLARLQSTPTASGQVPASGWVSPGTTAAGVIPVSAASAPAGWVTPKTQSQ